jgi:hypothetical protein
MRFVEGKVNAEISLFQAKIFERLIQFTPPWGVMIITIIVMIIRAGP